MLTFLFDVVAGCGCSLCAGTKVAQREYEVGFSYNPGSAVVSKQGGGEGEEGESEEESDDDNDLVFRAGMKNAGDSSDDEESSGGEGEENEGEKEKAVFTMKTLTIDEREQKAVEFKEQGNKHYKEKRYAQAIACYQKARQWLPLPRLMAICYSNESVRGIVLFVYSLWFNMVQY